jgi:hypothetical protein
MCPFSSHLSFNRILGASSDVLEKKRCTKKANFIIHVQFHNRIVFAPCQYCPQENITITNAKITEKYFGSHEKISHFWRLTMHHIFMLVTSSRRIRPFTMEVS